MWYSGPREEGLGSMLPGGLWTAVSDSPRKPKTHSCTSWRSPRSPGTLRPSSSIQFSPSAPSGAWRPHPGDTFPRVPPAPGSPPSLVNETSPARDPEEERSAGEPSGLLRRVPATQAGVCASTQGQRESFAHRDSSSIRRMRSLRSRRSPGAAKSRSGANETSRKERWGAIRRNRQHRRLTRLPPRFPGFCVAEAQRTAGPTPEGSAPRRAGDSRRSEHRAETPAWPARSYPSAAPLPALVLPANSKSVP